MLIKINLNLEYSSEQPQFCDSFDTFKTPATENTISLSVKISLERHVDTYCLFAKPQQIDSLGVNQR